MGRRQAVPAHFQGADTSGSSIDRRRRRRCHYGPARISHGHPRRRPFAYFTVTLTDLDTIPLATTTSVLAPVSIVLGTSKCVETTNDPVATPIELWLWVRA